jgi:signal transduction histidine kinase
MGREAAEERERLLTEALAKAVTEEKRRAEELARAYEELQRTQAMLVQAEKMAALGQLASGIAHELKNPLSIILQGVTYLGEVLGKKEENRSGEILELIKETVFRADRIIRGMLEFSAPARMEMNATVLPRVVEDSLTLASRQLDVHHIQVSREVAEGLPLVMADETQLKQVFINVIVNAFQAMPDGGRLAIRLYPATIAESQLGNGVVPPPGAAPGGGSAQRAGPAGPAPGGGMGRRATDRLRVGEPVVVCELRDTGTGVPPEVLSKVYDPFFTTKPPGEGTGLGLAISRSIVERHRGLIAMTSEPGQGTMVRITLPIAARDPDLEGEHG